MGLRNLTPLKMRCGCGVSIQCPAVYEEEDHIHLKIIGKRTEPGELAGSIGSDETIIRVERSLLNNVGGPISRLLMRLGL